MVANSVQNRLLGIDTGGTFTDFVYLEHGSEKRQLRIHKQLSTPAAPEQAILAGLEVIGCDRQGLQLIHGSTVATNAVLEGKGARVVFITNRGFADMLTIGRQAREELYNLQPVPVPPPVPAELCLETGGRLSAEGTWLEPLTEQGLATLVAELRELKPEAVAINLLFSWLNDEAERRIEAAIQAAFPTLLICRSSKVLPEFREYERGIATWLNAYVSPKLSGYLQRLEQGAAPAKVAVMQSSGQTMAASQAAENGVQMLLSGPAGGLMAAQRLGELTGETKLLTFDIGGTSTDVALVNGRPTLSSEGKMGRYPVAVPMVEMHTIGAGGGSLASVDEAGALLVGPESAGATPGPACYGQGGTQPTVTDANLLLGRLVPDGFLGGEMALDTAAAESAMAALAEQLGCDPLAAASGIVELANEHMAQALRVISVQRGENPADYTLLSFGGAGGLHVCALAETLGMERALVPVHAGVLSALGMLAAPRGRQVSRSYTGLLADIEFDGLLQRFTEMLKTAEAELLAEGLAAEALHAERSVDCRYSGQSFSLNIGWPKRGSWAEQSTTIAAAFNKRHEELYGHKLDAPVELVNLRLALTADVQPFDLETWPTGEPAAPYRQLGNSELAVPVYARDKLVAGQQIEGPALITETVSTTWLAAGWVAQVDTVGNLKLCRISTI